MVKVIINLKKNKRYASYLAKHLAKEHKATAGKIKLGCLKCKK